MRTRILAIATVALSATFTIVGPAPSMPVSAAGGVTVAPAVGQANPAGPSDPIVFTITFDEPVTGFSMSDIQQTGLVSDYQQSLDADANPVFTYTVSPNSARFTADHVTISIGADVVTEGNTAAPAPATVNIDIAEPSVTIAPAAGQAVPAGADGVVFAITFSEPVVDLTLNDIAMTGLTNGYSRQLSSDDGISWTLTITPSNGGGTFNANSVTVSIPAGATTDLLGNANLASNAATVAIDIVGPAVSINQSSAQADPTATTPVVFTVVFSEPVTGFEAADVVLGGTAGATTTTVSGAAAIYTVEVSGMTADGSITASIPAGAAIDGVGNASAASTSTDNTVTRDTVEPNPLGAASRFVPLAPVRLFDTRVTEPGNGPKGLVGPDSSIDVQVIGEGDVPADAVAVVMNVTVTDTAGASFVSVYPKGASRPTVSSINIIEAGQTRANLVTVPIGLNGQVTLYSLAAANLLADVAGYYVEADEPVAAGRFVPVTPQRAFDTRTEETGAPGPKGKMAADQVIDVQILGFGDVPETGVSAVVINLTGTDASAPGFLTAFPNGLAVPFASNVNLATVGTTAPNLAIVPIGDGGMISIYSSGGAHALGDITGYITDGTADESISGLFVPLVPERTYDGRTSEGGIGFVPAGATAIVPVAGIKSIPSDASAVVLNVAGVDSPSPGFLTAWNTGVPRPTASTVNFVVSPLDTRANAAMLPVGTQGTISFYTLNGSDVLIDASGYFLK